MLILLFRANKPKEHTVPLAQGRANGTSSNRANRANQVKAFSKKNFDRCKSYTHERGIISAGRFGLSDGVHAHIPADFGARPQASWFLKNFITFAFLVSHFSFSLRSRARSLIIEQISVIKQKKLRKSEDGSCEIQFAVVSYDKRFRPLGSLHRVICKNAENRPS